MKRKPLYFVVLFFMIACASIPQNLSKPSNGNNCILGVSLSIKAPLSIFSNEPYTVYFVKIDEKGSNYNGTAIRPSNYKNGSYRYLVNAEPGKYIIVAGTHSDKNGSSYNTFFNKQVIDASMVVAKPGSVKFMGEIVVKTSTGIAKSGDEAQLHYYGILNSSMGGEDTGIGSNMASALLKLATVNYYNGVLGEINRDEKTTLKFFNKTANAFKDTGWIGIINEGPR
jgi:hypothetical protein